MGRSGAPCLVPEAPAEDKGVGEVLQALAVEDRRNALLAMAGDVRYQSQ